MPMALLLRCASATPAHLCGDKCGPLLASLPHNDSCWRADTASFFSFDLQPHFHFSDACFGENDPSSPFYDATEKVRIHEWRGDELTMPSQAAKTVRAPVTTAITITHFPNPFRDSLRSSQSHDLLNEVEAALARCAGQIENKIMGMIEATRPYISVEDLDVFILDWKTLARKHQVPTEQLR